MYKRGVAIYNSINDPFRHGYEPDHWKAADKLLDESDELLISGGNRSGKTEYAAKYAMKTLINKPDARVICFHTTHQSSLQNQIHSDVESGLALPPTPPDLGTVIAYVKWRVKASRTFLSKIAFYCRRGGGTHGNYLPVWTATKENNEESNHTKDHERRRHD
jgi:hypothetical protein